MSKPAKKPTTEKVSAKPTEETLKVDRTQERIDRFSRVAEGRTNRIIDGLASLGKIPENKNNYIYTEGQVLEIFTNLETFLSEIKMKYLNSLSSSEVKDRYKVKYTDL